MCKLNISFNDKFSPEIKFNWLMRKQVKANLYKRKLEISIKQDRENGLLPRATGPPLSVLTKKKHKLAAQKTFFPNLASRQMKTKLYFSS